MKKDISPIKSGFTLIELLVVISIIGILMAISIFGLTGARESARDGRRKSDLGLIQSGLELYKADCNSYPTSLGKRLKGTSAPPATCSTANTYINSVPKDPLDPARTYTYSSAGVTYTLCASLENIAGTCNYTVTNP